MKNVRSVLIIKISKYAINAMRGVPGVNPMKQMIVWSVMKGIGYKIGKSHSNKKESA